MLQGIVDQFGEDPVKIWFQLYDRTALGAGCFKFNVDFVASVDFFARNASTPSPGRNPWSAWVERLLEMDRSTGNGFVDQFFVCFTFLFSLRLHVAWFQFVHIEFDRRQQRSEAIVISLEMRFPFFSSAFMIAFSGCCAPSLFLSVVSLAMEIIGLVPRYLINRLLTSRRLPCHLIETCSVSYTCRPFSMIFLRLGSTVFVILRGFQILEILL